MWTTKVKLAPEKLNIRSRERKNTYQTLSVKKILEYYFSHPAAFLRALQKFQKYPWFGFRFPN